MYQHIVVAIDDSETSRKALEEAIALARLHGAGLEIVHAVDETMVQSYASHGVALSNTRALHDEMLGAGQAVLDTALAQARNAGLQPQSRLLIAADAQPAEQIARAVTESGADLLVVGSHGRRGFRRLLLGSVAESLMRKIAVSVLIVRSAH